MIDTLRVWRKRTAQQGRSKLPRGPVIHKNRTFTLSETKCCCNGPARPNMTADENLSTVVTPNHLDGVVHRLQHCCCIEDSLSAFRRSAEPISRKPIDRVAGLIHEEEAQASFGLDRYVADRTGNFYATC